MITIHHLETSQSERIVWLCEERGLAYELKSYPRDPVTRLAPPDLRAIHPLGNAPIIEDGSLILAESGAIVEYILAKYGNGRLALPPDHPGFAQYLYWFHFANGGLQPGLGRNMLLHRLNLPADHPMMAAMQGRLNRALDLVNARLGEAPYFAGDELTAADIMSVFSLTTMRHFVPLDLAPYAHIQTYLKRIASRPAYQRAMGKPPANGH